MYSVEKTKGINLVKRFDYLLFTAVMVLSVIGLFILYSATRVMPSGADGDKIVMTQAIGLVIGVAAALVLSAIDYKDFKSLGIILYIISIVLLVLVLIPGIGVEKQGSRSWFKVPFLNSFQPAELAKITFIIFISIFLERIKESKKAVDIIKLVVYSIIPVALIQLQPDTGTVMVFVFVIFVMIYVCGLPYKYIIWTFILSIPAGVYLWLFKLDKYQKERFLALFNPDAGTQTYSFNVTRSKMAIGSGGIFGQGYLKGLQTQRGGVPVKESDFIFSVIGEELGFVGVAIAILLIFFLLIRCIYIAKNSRDLYGSFMVIGVASMLAFHFIENIGMGIGVLPVTGIPLPFVSQGGSSMITNFIAMGVVMSVSSRRKKNIFNSSQ